MTNQPIKISENCWKHTSHFGSVFYKKTSDPESEYHREDGPAAEFANGNKYWYIDGKRHRLDGPAVEYSDGYKIWYYYDKCINVKSQEEFEIYIKNLLFI